MSCAYDNYILDHKTNIKNGFLWIQKNLPEVLIVNDGLDCEWLIDNHDFSKNSDDEYNAYDHYFYGQNKSYNVVQEFNKAWLNHIHKNPHHWQHWVLIEDDSKANVPIEMPYSYVIEMICDWWSFSWAAADLSIIFSWYEEHKKIMILHPNTKKNVEYILDLIAQKIN